MRDREEQETLPITPAVETLINAQNNPLCWFIKDLTQRELASFQQNQRQYQVQLPGLSLSVLEETDGGDPKNKPNEDTAFNLRLTDSASLFGILDGATSKKIVPGFPQGIKPAWHISHMASLSLVEIKDSLTGKNMPDATAAINDWIRQKYQSLNIAGLSYQDRLTIPAMSAVLAKIDTDNQVVEIANVADTLAVAEYDDGSIRRITIDRNKRFNDEIYEKITALAKKEGKTRRQIVMEEPHRSQVLAWTAESSAESLNQPNGCGVLNGEEALTENGLVDTYTVPFSQNGKTIKRLWLLSDGALLPFPDIEALLDKTLEPLDPAIDQAEVQKELRQTIQKLSQQQKETPVAAESWVRLGINVLDQDPDFATPRFKPRDDSTLQIISFDFAD